MTKEDFELLPDNEKRVVIAKDVIQQLNSGHIIASQLGYIGGIELALKIKNSKFNTDFRDIFNETTCYVCAKGALFVSDIMLRDEFKINSQEQIDEGLVFTGLSSSKGITTRLNYFSKSMLSNIEWHYEGWQEYRWFHDKYPSDKQRMTLIMKNIINNKGEFVPEKLK